MYKWLELRFLFKLNRYLVYKLDRCQVGFVMGMGTHVNIAQLIREI